MAPAGPKGNFKTYEGQARLLRAVVAAHPEVKWDHKKIVKLYGNDMTVYGLEHRMKDIKAQSKLVVSAANAGVDCAGIPVDLPKGEKSIAKIFGASTVDGIQWQFRGIKKDAEALKAAADKGEAVDLNLGTPKPRSGGATKRAAPKSRSTNKRQKILQLPDDKEDDQDDEDMDFDAMDDSPSNKRRHKKIADDGGAPASLFGTPSRAATSAAAAAIKGQSIDLTSDDEIQTPPAYFDEPIPGIKAEPEPFISSARPSRPIELPAVDHPQGNNGDYTQEDFAAFLKAIPDDHQDYLDGEI